jgi:hypothetical protein
MRQIRAAFSSSMDAPPTLMQSAKSVDPISRTRCTGASKPDPEDAHSLMFSAVALSMGSAALYRGRLDRVNG